MIKDYRITIKVRNNRLLRAIEEHGAVVGQKWCSDVGIAYTTLNSLINMTYSPLDCEGKLRPIATNLCEILGKLPEDLWSNEQLYPLEKNFSEMDMDYAQVCALLPKEDQRVEFDDSGVEQRQLRDMLEKVLDTLTQRESKVLRMHFFEGMTLPEIAEAYGVSRTRILQLELKAMRKLRTPGRAGLLVDARDDLNNLQRRCAKKAAGEFLATLDASKATG
jgi:RNA polymerase sigma factor (sigma-70 family)